MIRWEIKFTITEFHLIALFVAVIHLALLPLKLTNSSPTKPLMAEKQLMFRPIKVSYTGETSMGRKKSLRNLLQGTSYGAKSLNVKAEKPSSTGVIHKDVAVASAKMEDFNLSEEQKKNLFRRLIKKHMASVELCKKSHLLKDEFLMGTMNIDMKINDHSNSAVPRFKGHGNANVIKSLEGCVREKLAALSFPQELANQEISFDFRIN